MTEEQLARLPAILFEVGKLLGSDQETGALLSRLSELCCQLLACDSCSVMLVDARRTELLARAAWGLRTEKVHKLTFSMGEGVAGWVAQRAQPALIDDVSGDPRFLVLDETPRTPIVSLLCVPMIARGQVVGVLTATSGQRGYFHPSDIELLGFLATTIALDMENLRLHRVAVTDPLTGAYNREFLAARLPTEIDSADQGERALSVAMVDVDHFKDVNDRHGHDVGDDVLCEIARRLRAAIRGGDLLVRYGGEEFLVVLPRANAGQAWEVGERMRAKVSASPVVVGARLLPVRVSVGIAQYRQGESASVLVRRADGALYHAKANGRDRVEVA
ncbi:MAG: sensor domain-containing diguanylate cyclase [Deltaproteobacteria bacterium]|nr:sensor domain-containing diguanylate cyclase [Kofleriaceae bacterium]